MLVRKYNTNLFDELFDDFFNVKKENDNFKVPVYDIIENDDEFIVEMLLAGVKKKDVSLDIEGDELIITAERKENKEINYNMKQSYFGKYKRTFILPEKVNRDDIDASLLDGVLTIKIPKTKNKKSIKSKIEVK